MEEVPADVLFCNILSRLPPKSLLRLTSVSKEWLSFIRTPAFANMHLHHVINDDHQNHHKLVVFSTTSPFTVYTIDCEAADDGLTAAHQSRCLPFKVRPDESMSIVACLHGMLCVAISKPWNDIQYSDLILWNPLTGDHKTLSKPSFHIECLQMNRNRPFGLYYSSSDDDYRLVRVTHHPNIYYIYSLKSDSWRKVELAEDFPMHNWFLYVWSDSPSVLLNEKLYFLRHMYASRGPSSLLIICFDTKTETLREIATPPFTNQMRFCMGFMVLRGCIHLFLAIEGFTGLNRRMELWRLDGDKDWTKVETCKIRHFSSFDQICHIMRNGNWLMHSSHNFYQLNTKKHTKDMVLCAINSTNIRLGEKYVETIVSPNQYIKEQDRKARDWIGLL